MYKMNVLAAGSLAMVMLCLSACSNNSSEEANVSESEKTVTSGQETKAQSEEPYAVETTSTMVSTAYEAEASGYGGQMNVKVTINNGEIKELELGDNHETKVVIDRAFPVIRQRILEANSPVVDSVSGATFSSYGVKAAVADAMTQAGMDVEEITMSTKGPEKEARNLEDVTADILIVGGGPAGLSAAITAKQNDENAHIILIEKLDILSGNGKFDMNFFGLINSEAQKKAGVEKWTVNQVQNFIEDKSDAGDTPERVEVWAEQADVLDAWLRDMDIELNYNYNGTSHMAEEDLYAGEVIQAGLEACAKDMGIDIRTGTKGLDLIMEDGRCLGVTVENNQNEHYVIKAQNTIIATGGFCSNRELLAEYAPGYEILNTSNQLGTTGDFVKVFEKNGFKLENMGNMSIFKEIIAVRRDLTGGADLNLIVNKEGKRFFSEGSGGLKRGIAIQEQPDGAAYYITDQTGYDSFYRIRKQVNLGYYSQGQTLTELAETLGVDANGLEKTVSDFNENVDAGVEDDLLGKVASRKLDSEGPYYGVRIEAANHMTKGGVACNEKAQILYEDGSAVKGLYGAGEVTWQSGGYSQSVIFGRVAGEQAAVTLE